MESDEIRWHIESAVSNPSNPPVACFRQEKDTEGGRGDYFKTKGGMNGIFLRQAFLEF